MIDLATERPIRLEVAARQVGHNFSTVFRWIVDGVKAYDGSLVRLEAVRLGRKWVTSQAALQRFAERLTPDLGAHRSPTPRPPAKRQRASEAAGQKLQQLGI
jgi:hypothetical protein